MRVVLAGGGTGGHIYPALAIGQGILKKWPGSEIIFIGTSHGLENTIVPETGLELKIISAQGLDRSSMIKALGSALKVPIGFWQARNIIKEFRPDIIIGTGGYVSYPTVMAGSVMGFKTVIHEQNALPGLANRALAKRADYVLLTFREAEEELQAENMKVTGIPVRPEISLADRGEAYRFFALAEDKFTILAVGGSRGAASINRAMAGLVNKYQNTEVQIIWITGEQHYQNINDGFSEKGIPNNVRIYPFLFEMAQALAAADLAICRAGAATIAELAVRGVPAVLVPYPYAAENHQEKNARSLEKKGAALTVIDEFLDSTSLYAKIEELRNNKFRLLRMAQIMKEEGHPRALEDILMIVEEVVSKS